MSREKGTYGVAIVTVRPDSRDSSKDFKIYGTVAKILYNDGLLAIDVTNGGYGCPIDLDERSREAQELMARLKRMYAVD